MTERVYVALDLETTGLDANRDAIIEIGAVRFQGNARLDRFVTFVNPQRSIPLRIQQITGIRNADVAGAPTLAQVLPELLAFVRSDVTAVIAHNAGFDLGFLRAAGVNFHRPVLDTFELATILLPSLTSYNLGELCRSLAISLLDEHRALGDAEATAQLFMHLENQIAHLPSATVQTLLACGQAVEWPPLLLFEAAARKRGANSALAPAALGKEETASLGQQPQARTSAPESLLKDSSAVLHNIPATAITAFFDSTGPLAQQLGPTYEMRTGQVQMAQSVMQALNTGDHLLVEAGTGTGKSLAYLLPATLWSLANQRRVVIATNTIALQEQLLDKDIPQLQAVLAAAGQPTPTAALLKGRNNYLCQRRLRVWHNSHSLTPTELTFLAKVLVWLPLTDSGDVSELFLPTTADRALWARVCCDAQCTHERCGEQDFFWRTRRRAEYAHLLVVNHALLLADLVSGGRVLPPFTHLIVDEAHRLEEAATEQLTYRAEWQMAQALLRRLTLDGDLIPALVRAATQRQQSNVTALAQELSAKANRAGKMLRDFAEKLLQFARGQEEMRKEAGYPQRLGLDSRVRTQRLWSQLEVEWDNASGPLRAVVTQCATLVRTLEQAHWWQEEPAATLLSDLQSVDEPVAELAEQMNRIIFQPPNTSGSGVVTWLELNDAGDVATLALAPLYVNELLEKELIKRQRSAIFTGATLRTGSGFRFIRDRLGLWDIAAVTVDSPFDYKKSTLLFLPNNLPAPNHPNYQQAVEQAIITAAEATGGRTLALFTSYAHLRSTADAIRSSLDRQGITVLQHGSSSRNRLLREYRQAEKAVLLGTRSFWEGIDLPGDELSCLLIVRLPFAVPSDPLVAARTADLEDPFTDYTLPDAILRFRQGFGRLIRRATDRGVIVILDSRLWQKEYGRAFLESLPTCTIRHAPLSNLAGEIEQWLEKG
ncbi:MAG: helicase C-terminal domain-containing protein [Caldilineaceae bacterium]